MRTRLLVTKLPWRLIGSFLLFSVVALVLGGLVHRQAERWSEGAALRALQATVRIGAHSMDLWLAERFADADVFADNILFRQALFRHTEKRGERTVDSADIDASLEAVRQRYGYKSASLVDTVERKGAFISGQMQTLQDIAAADIGNTRRVQWIDLQPRSSAKEYRAAVVRRVAEEGPLSKYVLFLEVETLQLARTLAEARALDLQGDSVLIRKQGRDILRYAPVRDPAGELLVFAADVAPGSVEHQLLTSSSAEMKGRSLNGRAVIAVRERLTLPGWFLVGMLDESAVLVGLRDQTRVGVIGYGLLLAVVATALVRWVRSERDRQTEREAHVVQFYDQILRHGDALFILTDWRGKIVDASFSAFTAFGYSRSDMLGQDVMQLVPKHARQDVLDMVRDMHVGESRHFLGERMRSAGTTFFVEGTVGLLEIRGRRYFYSVGTDVTSERDVQAQLKLAASVFDLAPAAIVVADKNLEVLSANSAFTAITGYGRQEVIGRSVQEFDIGPPGRSEEILGTLSSSDFWEGEVLGRRKNGDCYPRRLLAAVHRDETGEVDRYIGIFTDLTQLKQAEIRADFHASHDPLTQLPNRRRLDQLLPAILQHARDRARSVTLALFNLDRFKSINESFGLTEGDQLLEATSSRLKSVLPEGRLFHLGADEFAAVLDGAPVGLALTIDKTLLHVCAKVVVGKHALAPSVSVGVASFPDLAEDGGSLLRNAGAALRTAKEQGGKAWRLYEPAMNAGAYDDMLLAVDLRAAIDENQLELHFQPQARIADWSMVGMEALLRWKHPTRGGVPPSRFIPVAEASGLIDDLSRWVLGEACRIWAGWRSAGLAPPSIAVNVSPLQFRHADFLGDVSRTIARHDITPNCLVLELTESLIMDNSESAIGTMHRLTAMGVRIALDDFGTGYSSLSYLTRFPMDKLKIDRSFILPIGTPKGQEGEAIVKSVISMARALNLRVVAEGVELREQAQFLEANGCDELQGYLFSEPLSEDDLRAMLQATLARRSEACSRSEQPLSSA